MRINDYIRLATKNISRRKRSVVVSVVLVSLSMLIFIIALSFTRCFLDSMERAINKNISYRSIAIMDYGGVSQEDMIEKISQIPNIEKVVSQDRYEIGADIKKVENENVNGELILQGADKGIAPNITFGRNFYENEKGVCIIPEKFYPYDLYEDFNKDKIIDGKNLVGQEIEIKYYAYDYTSHNRKIYKEFKKKLQVIGTYDQDDSLNYYNCCYVSFDDIDDMLIDIEMNSKLNEDIIYVKNNGIVAIVNEAKNVEAALENINEVECRATIRSVANTELINVIDIVAFIISSFLIIIAIINISLSSIKSMMERKYEIGMLKAIGYKNRNIQGILFAENLLIGIISYIVTIILAIVINYFIQLKIVLVNFQLQQIGLKLNTTICIIALIISIIAPTLSSVFCNKKALKMSSVSLSKES